MLQLVCITIWQVIFGSCNASVSAENVEQIDRSDSSHEILSPEPDVSIEIKGLVKKFVVGCILYCMCDYVPQQL